MMPFPIVVGKRTHDVGPHRRGLIESRAESSIGHDAQLPGTVASLNATVIGRRIRRPVEPGGDREDRSGDRNRRSSNAVSYAEVPRPTDLSVNIRRAGNAPVVSLPRKV